MSKVTKELEKAQDTWEESEPAETGKGKVKPGEYVCKLKSMEVELAKSSGRLQVKTVLEVVEPEKYEGREIRRYDGLDETGIPYFKALCQKLGIEFPDKLKNLPDTLEEFVDDFDKTIEVYVVKVGDRTNTYINDVSGDEDEDDDSKDDDDDDDKDKDEEDEDTLKDLKKKIKKNDLDIDPDDFDDVEDLAKAVKKAMKKASDDDDDDDGKKDKKKKKKDKKKKKK